MSKNEFKFMYNDLQVCPYCKHVWDYDSELLANGEDGVTSECPSCEKEVNVIPHFKVTFSTYPCFVKVKLIKE